MSRKPINVELRGLKTPRERIWQAILELGHLRNARFDKTAVQDHCKPMVSWSQVDDYCDALEKAGYISRVGGSGSAKGVLGTPIMFVLQRRQGDAPRLSAKGAPVSQGSGTDAMWRAMKVLPVFDHNDIAKAASLGVLEVKPGTAKSYVAALAKAGYLATAREAKPGRPARHRLVNNTGPHAPAITRMKVVFDRNTGEFANLQTAQEVCDGLE